MKNRYRQLMNGTWVVFGPDVQDFARVNVAVAATGKSKNVDLGLVLGKIDGYNYAKPRENQDSDYDEEDEE